MSKIAKSTDNTPKDQYQIRNWSSYNTALKNRGSLTLWIDDDCQQWWYDDGPAQRGGQYEYSDKCIECLLMLKVVFRLAYRQTQCFAESILELLGLDVVTPSYSQINRRARDLAIDLEVPSNGSIHLGTDSTGLKVFGEGEWKVRKHGYSKRRTWRKLHLGVDENTGMIHAICLTKNDVDDAELVENMLDQVEVPVDTFSGDGAYDKSKCWDLMIEHLIKPNIPPQENAVYWLDENGDMLDHPRNQILAHIDLFGRKAWKRNCGYHRRSLSETAMFRFKTIFGNQLYSRNFKQQQVEAQIKTKSLNVMTAQGMPISVKVA